MRLSTGITAAALAGLAVAGHDSAEVYLFRSSAPQLESPLDASPRIPSDIARHIILQRTSRDRYGSSLRDQRSIVEDDRAVIEWVNAFGKNRLPLFGSADNTNEPAQLVVLLEGITAENAEPLREALSTQQPSFTLSELPSAKANDGLMADLRAEGVVSKNGCSIDRAVNPYDKSCWDGLSTVVRYNVKKSPEIISLLASNLARLSKFVASSELEAVLILLPETSRTSKLTSWSSSIRPSPDLRRRGNELVITDGPAAPAPTSTNSPASIDAFLAANAARARDPVPACFQSLNTCETRTNKCSGGHGVCIDKFANDTRAKGPCFACHCMRTVVLDGTEPGAVGEKTVRWAGNMCQKKDVSVAFWLLAGFTIGLMGLVTFAIGMLYSVGEEKLPGVIGAGVSRGSK